MLPPSLPHAPGINERPLLPSLGLNCKRASLPHALGHYDRPSLLPSSRDVVVQLIQVALRLNRVLALPEPYCDSEWVRQRAGQASHFFTGSSTLPACVPAAAAGGWGSRRPGRQLRKRPIAQPPAAGWDS